MATYPSTSNSVTSSISGGGELSSAERWISAAAGLGLTLSAARGRGMLARLLLASAGLSLLARSATGYCPMKSAAAGETSLQDGFREQFRRLRQAIPESATVEQIDSMNALYATELQELHSAETQLATITERLGRTIQDGPLAVRMDEYVTELRSRLVDLESLLARSETDVREHPDDAMRALVNETNKVAQIREPTLRDAAITASLQRILHYKIAGYGTIASYAKALGRTEEATHFADLADRDKTIDAELTKLAKNTLNPEAAVTPREVSVPGSVRTH